jgi:hypothetical protein
LQLLEILLGFAAILLLVFMEYRAKEGFVPDALAKAPGVLRWALYMVMAMAIASSGVFGNAAEFIYFQF